MDEVGAFCFTVVAMIAILAGVLWVISWLGECPLCRSRRQAQRHERRHEHHHEHHESRRHTDGC